MTPAQLNTLINFKCGTNDTTFPQADKLYLVNIFKDEIASLIVDKNTDFFIVPSTFNLVANQREYSFDDTILNRIVKLELKFSENDARFPATFLKDYLGSETESEIVKEFTNSKGGFAYVVRRRSIYILSGTVPNVTNGGRLLWYKYPENLSSLSGSTGIEVNPSTTTFGFPRQFHELLARRVAIEWKGAQTPPIKLNATELNYENDLRKQLDAISTVDNSGEIIGEFSYNDMGDNGWDY